MPPHIIIVGGGLAGPCLALTLAKSNIHSTILEIRDGLSESGGSITLTPDALRVLDKHAGVYDRIQENGFEYDRMGAYLEDGTKLGEIGVGEENGYSAIRVMRSTVQRVLINASEEMSGLIQIKWGVKVQKIEEDEDAVIARLANGEVVKGDILIGADGIHSKVREHILGDDDPKPVFTETCVVNGFLSRSSANTPEGFTFPAMMFTPSGLFMTIPVSPKGDTLAWGITTTAKERTREGWLEYEKSGEAAKEAKGNFATLEMEPVRSLLDNAKDDEAKVWAPYSIPDLPTWHKGRVCLIGDAAHALPPNGQGSAIAFQDAALLARMIIEQGSGDYKGLFTRFEKLRRVEVDKVKKSSKPAQAFKQSSGPWIWYLKKWMFWGFFTWKGGLVRMSHGKVYDVDKVDIS